MIQYTSLLTYSSGPGNSLLVPTFLCSRHTQPHSLKSTVLLMSDAGSWEAIRTSLIRSMQIRVTRNYEYETDISSII